MSVVHVVLVGTSLWRNLHRALTGGLPGVSQHLESRGLRGPEVVEAAGLCAWARPGSHEDVECGRASSGTTLLVRAALEALRVSPYQVSAELNAMRPWLEARREGKVSLGSVYLVHSDTGAGSGAAEVLRRYLVDDWGVSVEAVVVEGLGRRPESLASGLSRLYDVVRGLVERHGGDGDCVLLNATGGFKVESAYALMAAYRRALAAYYIHETFNEVSVIPLPSLAVRLRRPAREELRCRGDWYPIPVRADDLGCLRDALEPPGSLRVLRGSVEVNCSLARILVG